MASTSEIMVVLGASPNPERYSYKAVRSLLKRGYNVAAIGIREGTIEGVKIQLNRPEVENVHTILLYISPKTQAEYYDYIISLKPQRIIFNPGTDNYVLENLAKEHNIEVVSDCALVMLSTNTF